MKIEDFDKIYVLHLANRTDRYDNLTHEFGEMGLLDNIDIWWTCKRKVSTIAGNAINDLHTKDYSLIQKRNPDIYGAVFNCSLEHYTMIRTSWERGLDNILIFEDDVHFINDRSYLDMCLSQIPDDYSICKLYHTGQPDILYNNDNKLFIPSASCKKAGLSSTAAYCLNRDGMKQMINSYDKKFTCADLAFFGTDLSKLYINTRKILTIYKDRSDIL